MIDRESDAVRRAIEVLNRVHTADPTVLPALIGHRVPCNLAVADDPTVQVGKIDGTDDQWEVGLLGIINGLFGVQGEKAVGFIAANYDDDHDLTSFSYNRLEHRTTVHFTGGPWAGQTYDTKQVTAPVFAVGDPAGNHYWLDTKSDPPMYHWDGEPFEAADQHEDEFEVNDRLGPIDGAEGSERE